MSDTIKATETAQLPDAVEHANPITTPAGVPDGVPRRGAAAGPRRHGLLLAVAGGLLALGTAACVAVWLSSSSSEPPTPVTSSVEVYQPGGSVYQGQVPAAAAFGDPSQALAAGYGPGSQTYSEQVPSAATQGTWVQGYAPGSQTYSEQVPSSAG